MHTFLSKIQIDKYNKKQLGIAFLVGILLLVISLPTSTSEEVQVNMVEEDSASSSYGLDYKSEMEEDLTEILKQVEGVGEVQVMITLQTTTQKLVEKDQVTSTESIEETTIYGDTQNGQEPYVYQEIYPTVEGVVVAATGGDTAVVQKNITEAIQALFDVETHKIKIMKLKS
ncbi:MAG: stage III sporulation protein AG [Eubacteriales bacterium]